MLQLLFYPRAISVEALRERSWQLVLPRYLERVSGLVERFGEASAKGLGSADVAEIVRAVAAGRIAALLIEADRIIPGHFDPASGAIAFAPEGELGIYDLLDDLGERTLKTAPM